MTTATNEKLPYTPVGDFGFTNSADHIESVRQFRDAAAADGWSIEGTYEPSESIDRASRLTRDGFVMQIITRDNIGKGGSKHFEASVHIWGPDGLAITPPNFYDFKEMVARTRRCSACKAEDVDTVRYSFAGRCCNACLPEMRMRHEKPGWTR
jgi:hypothetical protein